MGIHSMYQPNYCDISFLVSLGERSEVVITDRPIVKVNHNFFPPHFL